jgi:hypothetical protein
MKYNCLPGAEKWLAHDDETIGFLELGEAEVLLVNIAWTVTIPNVLCIADVCTERIRDLKG